MIGTEMTMAEALHQVANSHSDQESLVCGQVRVTYRQLMERISALARGLHHLGLRKGDKIAALVPPGPEFVYLFLATAELGAVFVPINTQLRQRGLGNVLHNADPVALVTSRPIEDKVLRQATSLRHVVFTNEGAGGDLFLSNLMVSEETVPSPSPDVSPHDLLALLYTSGTTGTPKGVMHSHRSLIAPVVASIKLRELWTKRPSIRTLGQMAKALARYRERLLRAAGKPQTFLSTTGWHTITGLEVMLQAVLMGDRLVVMARFHPAEALQLVEQERVNILIAIPIAFQGMLARQDFEQYDTSSLLICGTGSMPVPPHLAHEIQHRFGCAVAIGFGATETGGGVSATSLADSDALQAETVGRPMPGMEVKVVDEQRRELPQGQVGELFVRSDSVMMGYYEAPDKTAEVMDEDGWYHTGDLALIDDKGYVRIVGRKKDMIIRGGQNIYPTEIEDYLTTHPKIRDAAVVGVPSVVGGESVWAFLILEDEVEMTTEEALSYCRTELESYKIPSRVRFVTEFPRSGTGKPQKFKLREIALQSSGDKQ